MAADYPDKKDDNDDDDDKMIMMIIKRDNENDHRTLAITIAAHSED